jgi:hypothetical protein
VQLSESHAKLEVDGAKATVWMDPRVPEGAFVVRLDEPIRTLGFARLDFEVTGEQTIAGALRIPDGTFVASPSGDTTGIRGLVVFSESPLVAIEWVNLPCAALRPARAGGPARIDPVMATGTIRYAAQPTPFGPRAVISLHAKPKAPALFNAHLSGVPLRVIERRRAWSRVEAGWTNGARLTAWVRSSDLGPRPVFHAAAGGMVFSGGQGSSAQWNTHGGCPSWARQTGPGRSVRIARDAFVADDPWGTERRAYGRFASDKTYRVADVPAADFVRVLEGPGLAPPRSRCGDALPRIYVSSSAVVTIGAAPPR